MIPETLLLHDCVNLLWGGLAPSRSLWLGQQQSPANVPGEAGTQPLLGETLPERI